ncbi:hypothetical protein C0Q70_14270 [Pomacea canaliculata]|uniref:FAD-binding domain-containing protein n=1 Tax=Pomacea canaliculata TaxID=400727 RepID=A0A2T7NZL9_POMCA|nr:hypothetical protein C0Q70_14270 [Pomacea canaliculata]
MVHDLDGRRRPIPYGKGDQHILSVDRHQLNVLLLNVEKHSNVTTYFRHKLHKCKFETGEIVLVKDGGEEVHRKVDLIVGSDGAHSRVRQQMMKSVKSVRLDFQQEFIPHGYIELTIPLTKNGDCSPYHVGDNVVLIGDAAHAMVPFYGQGMNCYTPEILSMFIIIIFILTAQALPEYTKYRNPDAKAICDLAMYNYTEVTFTRTRYHECVAHRAWQDKVLRTLVTTASFTVLTGLVWPSGLSSRLPDMVGPALYTC